MGLFRRRAKAEPEVTEERSLLLPGGLYAPSNVWSGATAGEVVTMRTALRNAAVWGCQRVLVSTISMLPVDVNRTVNGDRQPVTPTMMVTRPSARVSRRGWVAQNVRSLLGAGNIYGDIVATDSLMRPTQIETVAPDSVTWECIDGDEVPFVNGRRRTLWPLGDFWHVPASQFLMPGSRVAMSPVDMARTSIGSGLAAERFGADFFEKGVHPTSIYYVSDPNLTADQARDIKDAVMAAHAGREPGVLGADIRRETVMTNPSDSQFIDLLRFEVEQACRFWGVPPSMVYAAVSGQAVTYANVSQADLQFLKYSVAAWLVDFEDAWSDLIAVPHAVKFNVEALLRMDTLTRYTAYDMALKAKIATVDEVRALEDLPAFGGDFAHPGIPGGERGLSIPEQVAKIALGVNTLLSPDEAREILNKAGSDPQLSVPGPVLAVDPGGQQQLPLGGSDVAAN